MSLSPSDKTQLIEATAGRLRMVQLDFADAEPAERQKWLDETLHDALASIPGAERPAFAEALLERFPSWDTNVETQRAPADSAPRSTFDEGELKKLDFVLKLLIDLAPSLNDVERGVVKTQLAEHGLSDVRAAGAWDETVAARLRTALGLKDDADLDPSRVIDELCMLVECVRKLDKVCWKTWREMAPRSRKRGPVNLQKNLALFAAGHQDVPRGRVSDDLAQLHAIVAGLVLGIKNAAGEFSRGLMRRVGAEEIESAAKQEGKKITEAWETKYWKKYCEQATSLNDKAIEREIVQAVAGYAEKVMEGT